MLTKKIVSFAMLLIAIPAFAADYYVSPTGSDSSSGSLAYPYATITKAVSVASAGDTIHLRGGQHDYSTRITLSKSGTSSNPITIRAYQDEVPVLDFSGTSTGTQGIQISGSYWTFYGFIIQNAGDNGLIIYGTNNLVERLIARWNEDSGIQLHTGAADNLILNCDSYENYDPGNHGENADGFATKFGLGTGNILRGCRAWSNSDDGYDCWNTDPPSEAVTFHHCWAYRNGIDLWGEGSNFAGDGNGFKLGAGAGAHRLINCVAYDNPHNGIDVNGNTTGVHVYNCSAVMNGTVSGSNFRFDEDNSAHVLRNNVSYNGSIVMYDDIDDQYNSWNGFTLTDDDFVSLDPTGIIGDRESDGSLPQLSFLHPADGSTLVDAGTDVGLDYEGTAPDLGAYEYTGQDYPPAAPTGLTAAAGDNTVSLSWDANSESDLAGYNIYRSTTSGSGYVKLNSALVESPAYNDSTVTNGITCYYVITAVDMASNESANSTEASATPFTYGDFIINGTVDENDLGYLMSLWLENGCEMTAAVDVNGDCIINLYEFSAFALNWLIAGADLTPPAAPAGLSAEPGNGTVSLNWDDNAEADFDSYNVYRSVIPGIYNTIPLAAGLTQSSYTDDTVVNGTTYFYVVTAVDMSANESDNSNEDYAIPELPTISITIQENETGYCGVDDGGSVDSDNTGFTGDGFVNTQNAVGEGIDWSVNVVTAGTYVITWRYANGSGSDRPGNLLVDGSTTVSGISFPATTNWTTWDESETAVELTAGIHTLRLEATTNGGLANIDYIMLTGANPQPANCP